MHLAAGITGTGTHAPYASLAVACEAQLVLHAWQVVLGQDITSLGKSGTMPMCPNGYFCKFLQPRGMAFPATGLYLK